MTPRGLRQQAQTGASGRHSPPGSIKQYLRCFCRHQEALFTGINTDCNHLFCKMLGFLNIVHSRGYMYMYRFFNRVLCICPICFVYISYMFGTNVHNLVVRLTDAIHVITECLCICTARILQPSMATKLFTITRINVA